MRDSAVTAAGLAAGFGVTAASFAQAPIDPAIKNTPSYNPNMEYRRLGKTGLWVSAVCLGGHWKRINHYLDTTEKLNPYDAPKDQSVAKAFHRNRCAIVSRCMELGINLVDACTPAEMEAYPRALKGRRDKMYLSCSFGNNEMRTPELRKAEKLIDVLDAGLKKAKIEHVDLWRITALSAGGKHTQAEVEEMIKALDMARRQGKCRFTGCSSHDREWLKMIIEKYPDQIQVVLTPYTANSKVRLKDSLFDAVKKHDVGVLGIKPFASNSLFKGDSSPANANAAEDDRRAQLAIRYILSNPAITAPIPGLAGIHQVENVAQAVRQRRQLDLAEKAELENAAAQMWAALPQEYHWLKQWRYV
jgi:predicted aldo/keto reductase-like oxidoreductase